MPAAGEGGSAAAEVLKGRGSRYNRRKGRTAKGCKTSGDPPSEYAAQLAAVLLALLRRRDGTFPCGMLSPDHQESHHKASHSGQDARPRGR